MGAQIETGTVFMNRCDYLDPALTWTGVQGHRARHQPVAISGFMSVTRPKSYHLKKVTK